MAYSALAKIRRAFLTSFCAHCEHLISEMARCARQSASAHRDKIQVQPHALGLRGNLCASDSNMRAQQSSRTLTRPPGLSALYIALRVSASSERVSNNAARRPVEWQLEQTSSGADRVRRIAHNHIELQSERAISCDSGPMANAHLSLRLLALDVLHSVINDQLSMVESIA